ncbi:gamma-glutamyltransferase [Saccharopolyspora sp. HNM0983]|uniref:Glutathione hydrolase proenzyme n=1 Tax=Saccharopolyspora montiporae TaxID=2781240 RepID=A0A929B9C4_9PSEU|nr:gamma-glutamyltransferase [Saccharopolyspora sp. HNM0983]MBE9373437.1 gamma-glutamyltransferase [Saccharopolyspora sp. HNM0983]
MPARPVRTALSAVACCALVAPVAQAAPPGAGSAAPPEQAEAVGYGGAVSSVDPDATRAGVEVLRRGGNATDAAVAVAAALGVTEPYSAGVGGGGYFVHYDADSGKVSTVDGRERAPGSVDEDLFLQDGAPIPEDEAITSGLGTGVPGTPATWQRALDNWGSAGLDEVLRPATKLAENGFAVDETFREQTADNEERFRDFPATRELFLPGGRLPEVGQVLRNPDLAETYRQLGDDVAEFYRGDIGRDVAAAVNRPPVDPAADREVRPGRMAEQDVRGYEVTEPEPTRSGYRGLDVYGMPPTSSGGIAVGEALNVLERTDPAVQDDAQYLHRFLEASKLAFADRDRYVGDPESTDVPTQQLLDDRFAASRECLIRDDAVLPAPVAPGEPHDPGGCPGGTAQRPAGDEGPNTTHLTVADRSGDVVSYTLTIEQTGGNGIVVPGRGFLLNNELTDFDFEATGEGDPNLPGPGKRPRSSMSPVILLRDGEPVLAAGSPGGATIITTVLQVLTGRVDRGMPLVDAIAAPRASQRNTAETEAEPAFRDSGPARELAALGHRFTDGGEIGAATALERLPDGRWLAAAEPERRGGGAAAVVLPAP